jgi:LAGLIDADG endonuclease
MKNKKNSQFLNLVAEWEEQVQLVYADRFPKNVRDENGRYRFVQKIDGHEEEILADLMPKKVLKDVFSGRIFPSEKPSLAEIKDDKLKFDKEVIVLKKIISQLEKQIEEFYDQTIIFRDYSLKCRSEIMNIDEWGNRNNLERTIDYDLDKMRYGLNLVRWALDYKLASGKAEEVEVDPSLKDKGRAANKKPNNISKEFRRGFSSLSSLAAEGSFVSRYRRYLHTKTGGDKDSERNHPPKEGDSLPSPLSPSALRGKGEEKEKVLAQEGDERPSMVRRVFSGPKKREKKITQTVLPLATKLDYLVKDAPKKVEAERPNQRSHAQATKLGKAAKILVDKVKQDKDYQPSPKPASEKAKVDHPSFKDKGRAATEQPNNIFKGVRRDQWGLSSFAPNKGSRPKSFLRTKYKIFNPLKQLVGEHRESLVPDALKELEPAKHPEILVPDAVKRPVRRQKPASDIFSKSFFHPINSDNRLTSYVYPLEEKLRQPKGGGHIGDRKYFPAASTEWKNTIYVFNRNALYKNLPAEWFGKSLSMWVKLSNSGDTLKLFIPSNIRKVICGWTNHSCKVISQKIRPSGRIQEPKGSWILEKEIGNRGSKSIVLRNIEKEQRVDGSWGISFIPLRCNLSVSFARNTWVKIPSNPIINKWRTYMSTSLDPTPFLKGVGSTPRGLDPWFVTGFADAEGSFSIVFRSPKLKSGWSVAVRFQLNLSDKDLSLLERIQSYFNGVGSIFTKKGEKSELQVSSRAERGSPARYAAQDSIKDIKIVIDHFDKYPLKTKKLADYIRRLPPTRSR